MYKSILFESSDLCEIRCTICPLDYMIINGFMLISERELSIGISPIFVSNWRVTSRFIHFYFYSLFKIFVNEGFWGFGGNLVSFKIQFN